MTPLDPEASAEGRPIFFGAQIVEVVIVRNVEREMDMSFGVFARLGVEFVRTRACSKRASRSK